MKAPNSFQKALLKASHENTRLTACIESKDSVLSLSSENGLPNASDTDFGFSLIPNPPIANPDTELSIIAEGDENEMTRRPLASTRSNGPVVREEISHNNPTDPNKPNGAMSFVTASYDLRTDDDDDDTQAFPSFPSTLDCTFNDSEPTSTASSFPIDPYARDYETCELPRVVAEHALPEPSPHLSTAPTNALTSIPKALLKGSRENTRSVARTESEESALSLSSSANGVPNASDIDFGLSSTLNPPVGNPEAELSVIVEGDENEMSRRSLASTRPTGPIIHEEISYNKFTDPDKPNGTTSPITASCDPHTDDDDDDTQAFPSALDRTFNDSEPTSTASSFPIDPYARDYETHELPQVVAEHALPEPSPRSPTAPTLIRKASVPVFPSLPGPSPLRKSTRDSVVSGATVNPRSSTTTGTVTGTRSSWLNKARDVAAKRAGVVSGVKRKSIDLTGGTDYTISTEAYARASKVAKTQADGGIADTPSDTELAQREVKDPDGTRQGRLSVSDLVGAFENGEVESNEQVQVSTLLSKAIGSSVNSVLGGSKRSKAEPVKSIQLAAAAAKKVFIFFRFLR